MCCVRFVEFIVSTVRCTDVGGSLSVFVRPLLIFFFRIFVVFVVVTVAAMDFAVVVAVVVVFIAVSANSACKCENILLAH